MSATLGSDHPQTLQLREGMASIFFFQGDLINAAESYEAIVAIERKKLGDRHPRTLTSIRQLGMARWHQQRKPEAAALLREAADGFAVALGSAHPDAISAAEQLSSFLSCWH